MAIPQSQIPKHWNYFLMLEADLANLARYVDLNPNNYKTYSLELSRLLVSACGEVDSILRQICQPQNTNPRQGWNIDGYKNYITNAYPSFSGTSVTIPRYGLELKPWDNWQEPQSTNPEWWRGHNGIKHSRHDDFQKGNLKNVLNAMGGLYIALIYLHEPKNEAHLMTPTPSLFFPYQLHDGETRSDGSWWYNFNDL